MDLKGASAVITGGASGIGEASARNLASLGALCVIVDLQDEKGQEVASELGGLYVKADVADEEQVQAAMNAAMEMGPLRALVNGAGIGSASRTVDRNGDPMSLAQFEFVIRVNLIGTFNCIRLGAASLAKTAPIDGAGQRGAIVGMTLPIARDLVPLGIRINTIAPGLIDTPIYGEGEASDQFKAHLGQSVLFPKRLGYASELASMVTECITNDYMNGETIRVDGGVRLPPK